MLEDFIKDKLDNLQNKKTVGYFILYALFLSALTFSSIELVKYFVTTWEIPIDIYLKKVPIELWKIKLSLLLFVNIIWFYKWFKSRDLPVLKSRKVGIYLVPYFHDKEDSSALNSFIIRFKRDLEIGIGDIAEIEKIDEEYYVEELSLLFKSFVESQKTNNKKQAKKIEDKFNDLRLKRNVSYILYFDCLRRNEGEVIEIGNIRSIALHPRTSQYNQEILRRDLTLYVPKGLEINSKNEKTELDGVVGVLGPHIAYITAITYFLNNDYLKCITNAEKALIYKGGKSKIYERASSIISQAYIAIANLKLKEMYKNGNFADIDKYIENILMAAEHKNNSYSISLLLGIGYFLKNFDTTEARRAIKKGIGPQTNGEEWMISLSFLDIWDGKYVEAIKRIEKINWGILSNPILLDNILEFNEGIIKTQNRVEVNAWGAIISKKMGADANFGYYQDKLKGEALAVELKEYITKIDA